MTYASNAQKTPFTSTINRFATAKAEAAINLLGKALPCSVVSIPVAGVPIVTVKFEMQDAVFNTLPQVTVPVGMSEYVRLPIQAPSGGTPGTRGVVFPADVFIGGVTGLGSGNADFTQRGNLSTLVFFPVGNTGFPAVADPNAVTIYGPDGVTIRDSQSKIKIVLTPSGVAITGNTSITGNLSVTGGITATQDIVAGTISLRNHVHGRGTPVAGGTLPPSP